MRAVNVVKGKCESSECGEGSVRAVNVVKGKCESSLNVYMSYVRTLRDISSAYTHQIGNSILHKCWYGE